METLGASASQTSISTRTEFICKDCNYICSKRSNYNRHLLSTKHKLLITDDAMLINVDKILTNDDKMLTNVDKNVDKNVDSAKTTDDTTTKSYICECGKLFKYRQSLHVHKKKCQLVYTPTTTDICANKIEEPSDKDLIMLLIKENQDFKNLILEIVKKDTYQNSNNNINTTNSHNKAFNLQFFLNETCKDAMNITDFVESIKLQLSDTENVGKVGYVEGISSIIVRSLKELDVTQRPVHCTDQKRETMYIKDDDKWERDEDQKKMHKIVRKVTDKNARMVMQFKEVHPDCMTSSSRYSDQYRKIIMEAMCGRGDNTFEKEEKIIKKISKAVLVNKDNT